MSIAVGSINNEKPNNCNERNNKKEKTKSTKGRERANRSRYYLRAGM
jgi:hypothetical protein